MKISVIIAIYNQGKYISQCLLSLQEQTYSSFEIIAINDGSTDKTWQTLTNLKSQISNIKVLRQNHMGPARARNLGAKKAKGNILVFIDGDMYFDKDFLKDLVAPIQAGQTKGTFSINEYVANWDNVWARCWNYNWGLPDKSRVDPENLDQQKDFRALLKSEFEKTGGFDPIGYTDTWSLSEKLGYLPWPTKAKYYHFNPDSLKKVFLQAKWVAKRKYKLGFLGKIISLLRANFIFSLINGCKIALIKKEQAFIIFKLVYDCGITLGLLQRKKYA